VLSVWRAIALNFNYSGRYINKTYKLGGRYINKTYKLGKDNWNYKTLGVNSSFKHSGSYIRYVNNAYKLGKVGVESIKLLLS
jgi:hypothetical protein